MTKAFRSLRTYTEIKYIYIYCLTLSQCGWVMCSAHCLIKRNIWMKCNETTCSSNGLGDMEWTQIEGQITWPWIVTLTLSLCSRVIGSALCLTKRNIWVKFNENRLKGSWDMELTRNSRVNPMTLTCDPDLESTELGHVLCTPSY